MQFSTILSSALLALTVSAAPLETSSGLTTESITIDSVYVRDIDSKVSSVGFDIISPSVECEASPPPATGVIPCSDSAYSFYIARDSLSKYNLTIYHATGVAVGLYQPKPISLACRAGGSSASDYVCNNASPISFTLSFDGTQ